MSTLSATKLLPAVTVGLLVTLAAVTGMLYAGSLTTSTTDNGGDEIRRITVSGLGEVKTVPDRTRIVMVISTEAIAAEEASSANADVFQRLSTALTAAGVAKGLMETLSYNINPVYEYPEKGRPILVGYEARHRLSVTVAPADPAELGRETGKIIDLGVAQGITIIEQIETTVSDDVKSKLKDEALTKALTAAKAKGQLMASALALTLGAVQSVSEAGFYESPPPIFRGSIAEAKAATEIVPGAFTITASVSVVYALA